MSEKEGKYLKKRRPFTWKEVYDPRGRYGKLFVAFAAMGAWTVTIMPAWWYARRHAKEYRVKILGMDNNEEMNDINQSSGQTNT
mmetsp:Transcript_1950/g.2461  ORF Transcript_1950/g.2461 Transcript_1950/m.2461 type:complete len:84 (-) Transcript_1950:101-352(-)